ncbi:MAG: M48 family metalloprotease, partial [Aestuariivirgaceae bacterium]|nr:M48 family metalloprotease [Aestuariivirgaceae bacterium]
GHLARMGQQMDKASTTAILGMLLGAAAVVGGAASGQGEAAQMGQGIMLGTQGLAQRNLLSYARAQEASADQAAVKFLDQSGQSGEGMLTLFQTLANQSLGSLQNVNPYVMSHPMPLDRIRNLEQIVKQSPNYRKADSPALMLRHNLMQAKLTGFIDSPQQVYQRYPRSDTSLPGRYARAIAAFRVGDLKSAIPEINALIEAQPANPYFWELKGQALIEGGRPADAVAPLQQATKLAPQAGLIQIMLAQAQLGTENNANASAALKTLQLAARTESDNISLWRFRAVAYGKLGDIPNAELSTAEAAMRGGDRALAAQKAKSAMAKFAKGTPEWVRANDILNFTAKKKG